MSAQATSWLSRVTVSTVRRQRYAETTEEIEVAGSRRRRRRTMLRHDGHMVSSQMEGLLARAKPLGYFTGSWIGPHTSSITWEMWLYTSAFQQQHFSISMFVSTSSASPLWHIVEKRLCSLTTSRLSSSSTTSSFWVTSGMSNLPLQGNTNIHLALIATGNKHL